MGRSKRGTPHFFVTTGPYVVFFLYFCDLNVKACQDTGATRHEDMLINDK